MTASIWLRAAALLGFLGVGLGAFGAHGLRGQLAGALASETATGTSNGRVSAARRLEVFETGVRYHLYHALALLAVAWLASLRQGTPEAANIAGFAFVAGILLFSGSLYLLGLTGTGWLGAITPLGGVAFLIGWARCFYRPRGWNPQWKRQRAKKVHAGQPAA